MRKNTRVNQERLEIIEWEGGVKSGTIFNHLDPSGYIGVSISQPTNSI